MQHMRTEACNSARTHFSQGILEGPPCTETDAICAEEMDEAWAERVERRANGAFGTKALAAPAATAMRATWNRSARESAQETAAALRWRSGR
jgi:hypothetical protein